MQPQINAIKQLLEINNITASQIEEILVQSLGDRASWENASGFKELSDFDDYLSSVGDDTIQLNEPVKWDFGILWRSRIDLNDARINAEEVDLEEFLNFDAAKDEVYALRSQRDRAVRDYGDYRNLLGDVCKKLSLPDFIALKNWTVKHDIQDSELANSTLIAPNLEAFKGAVYEAVSPALLEKIEERDRQIQELQASLRNHHEQFDALKSRTEVTLKAINMMLESLKGDRKPDEVKKVDGVMVRFRDYDDNLTHHHKIIIIGNIQRAIANEARNLEARTLQDFAYDDQPF